MSRGFSPNISNRDKKFWSEKKLAGQLRDKNLSHLRDIGFELI